jgi:hypothetical protein
MRRNRLIGGTVVLIGALLAIVGSILPWARVEGNIVSLSKSGTQGDGALTMIAGIIILVMGALMLVLESYGIAVILSVLGGLGCAAVAVIDLVDLSARISGISNDYLTVKAGEGIYMVLVAGIIVVIGAAIDRIGAPAKGASSVGAKVVGYACPYCGKPVNQDDRFCSSCGARFPQQ